MAEKFRVYNDRHYDIGVKLLNGQDRNIKSGSFVMLSQDEIDFIESQCVFNKKMFGTGKLRIDKADTEKLEDMGIVKSEYNFHPSTDELEDVLHGTLANLRKWLEPITDKSLLAEVYDVAKGLDLTASKMKAIEATLPDLLALNEDY